MNSFNLRKARLTLLAISFALTLNADPANAAAGDPKVDCSSKAISAARKKFKPLYDKKKFAEARDLLKPFATECFDGPEEDDDYTEAWCWNLSDYALAQLKAGDPYSCRQTLATEYSVTGKCNAMDEDPYGAGKAINTNMNLCSKEIEKLHAIYKPKACTLKLPPKTVTSLELPSKDPKSKECLALIDSKYGKLYAYSELPEKEWDLIDEKTACPSLVKLSLKPDGKSVASTPIETTDTMLSDTMGCCYFDTLGSDGKTTSAEFRISSSEGMMPPCGNRGTARTDFSGNFKIEKSKLKTVRDTSWATH